MANQEFIGVDCGDDFTTAASIRDVFGTGGGSFEIENQSAIYRLQYGNQGQDYWTPERTIGAGGGIIPRGVTGVEFRNAVAGSVARVSALIHPPNMPYLTLAFGNPSGGVNSLQVFNVKTYHAKGDGVTDDTAAINLASAAAAAVGGIVYFPAGIYVVTTMLLYSYVWYLGVGEGGHASGGPTIGSIVTQKNGTSAPIVQTVTTTGLFSIRVEGISFTASSNLTFNTGGMLLTGCLNSLVTGVTVDNVNTYGVKVLGGSGGLSSGDTMYNTLNDVRCTNLAINSIGFYVAQAAAGGSKPDGLVIDECFISASDLSVTALKIESTSANVIDTVVVDKLRSIGPGIAFNIDGNYPRVLNSRFECFGNMTMSLSARTNDALLDGNSYSAQLAGTITLTDLGARTRHIGETGLVRDVLYPEDRQSPVYTNNWSDFGSGTNPVHYWRDVENSVHLEGLAKAPPATITNSMFTLPAAYRPSSPRYFVVTANDAFAGLVVNTDGTVQLRVGGAVNGTLSLEGLSYRL